MEQRNNLYPIFLKADQLNILIVGGGKVGHEKLHFLLKSSPHARAEVMAKEFLPETETLAHRHGLKVTRTSYSKEFLKDRHLVIAATNDAELNRQIHRDARELNLLANIADTPDLCDFYMGGIVTKGQVKIAISTNGRSPTTAKRLRQFFEEIIPENIDRMVENLHEYRQNIKGNLEEKVYQLNKLTESLIVKKESNDQN